MTKADKDYLEALMNGLKAEINGKFDVVNTKLERIDGQTTKTNGRVTALELKPEHNALNCPYHEVIQGLVDDQKTTNAIKKWKLAAITMAGIIIGAIGTIITVFK